MSAPTRPREDDLGGPRFWITAAVGLAIVAFGIAGLLRNVHDDARLSWAKLLLGGIVAHDGIALPLVALLSVALVRVVPAHVRPPLQGALVVSVVVVLVALPVLTDAGRLSNNPSLLPSHRYGTHVLAILGVVWLCALLLAIARGRRRQDPAPEKAEGDRLDR
ncbi:MAG TPA: hypothetical protein VFG31_05140 [Conexibacter sp.]|nr:hypothetical protein [Conexibacter sp.]